MADTVGGTHPLCCREYRHVKHNGGTAGNPDAGPLDPCGLHHDRPRLRLHRLRLHDANVTTNLATFKTDLKTVIDNVRAKIGNEKPTFLGTILPQNCDATREPLRLPYNEWLRTMPYGVAGVLDFDTVLRDPSNPGTRAGYNANSLSVPTSPCISPREDTPLPLEAGCPVYCRDAEISSPSAGADFSAYQTVMWTWSNLTGVVPTNDGQTLLALQKIGSVDT